MQLILGSLSTSRLYTSPNNEPITNCLIQFIGGNGINQPNALSYWYKPVIVTPLVSLSGELVVLPTKYECKYQRTFINLPTGTIGINLFVPIGNVVNVYIN